MRLSLGLLPFVVGCASAFSASLCQAQASPSVEGRGKYSIGAEVGSNTLVGVGLRAGARTDIILEAGARVLDDGATQSRVVSVQPALKRYWGPTDGNVAPYFLLGLKAEWNRLEFGGSRGNSRKLGGLAGVGVDWFPMQRVSVGGHIGVEALAVRSEAPFSFPGPASETTGHEIGTFSSGLRLRLFF